MKCPNCNEKIQSDDDSYCPYCDLPLINEDDCENFDGFSILEDITVDEDYVDPILNKVEKVIKKIAKKYHFEIEDVNIITEDDFITFIYDVLNLNDYQPAKIEVRFDNTKKSIIEPKGYYIIEESDQVFIPFKKNKS